MQIEQILSNELQLGQQLNNSVGSDRANFALLLALMSQDVEDQAQFHLAVNTDGQPDSFQLALRTKLEVPELQPLVADDSGEQKSLLSGRIANEHSFLDARLRHCISPEPLSFELGKKCGIDGEIFDNLDLMTAKKFSGEYEPASIDKIVPDAIIARQQNYAAQLI